MALYSKHGTPFLFNESGDIAGVKDPDGSEQGLVTFDFGTGVITDNAAQEALRQAVNGYQSSRRVLCVLGDSRVYRGADVRAQESYVYNLLSLLGQPYDRVYNFSVGGKTLAEIVAEQLPQVAALSEQPTDLLLDGGVNDMYTGSPSLAALKSSRQQIADYCASNNIRLIDTTTMPIDDLSFDNKTILRQYNAYKAALRDAGQGVLLDLVGIATKHDYTFRANFPIGSGDFSHFSEFGAWAASHGLRQQYSDIVGGRDFKDLLLYRRPQLVGNPTMLGSNAADVNEFRTDISGATGPDGYQIYPGGTVTVVTSQTKDGKWRLQITAANSGTVGSHYVEIKPRYPGVFPWVSGASMLAGQRVKHATRTDIQYKCQNTVNLPSTADQTAGYSTTVGDVINANGLLLEVVPAFNVQGKLCSAWDLEIMADCTGNMKFDCAHLNASLSQQSTTLAGFVQDTTSVAMKAGRRVVMTDVFTPHASAVAYAPNLKISPAPNTTITVELSGCYVWQVE